MVLGVWGEKSDQEQKSQGATEGFWSGRELTQLLQGTWHLWKGLSAASTLTPQPCLPPRMGSLKLGLHHGTSSAPSWLAASSTRQETLAQSLCGSASFDPLRCKFHQPFPVLRSQQLPQAIESQSIPGWDTALRVCPHFPCPVTGVKCHTVDCVVLGQMPISYRSPDSTENEASYIFLIRRMAHQRQSSLKFHIHKYH